MKYEDFEGCGLKKALDMISGKWTPPILYFLFNNQDIRFNDLWREIPRISKKVLAERLKHLENVDLISKRKVDSFPVEVYYSLSEKGKSLGDILSVLDKFGSK
ncbi:winged helix-turn-helix transcriptional regulator [Aquimarina addita]|uniref:Winged helix-turn-helix transcriptional regulator n=1 Tax=Aquimarina addita TaxID=870485 RepID=A0ABP7XH37_9FLAO